MLDPMPDDPPDSDEPRPFQIPEIPERMQEIFGQIFAESPPGIQIREGLEAILDVPAALAGDEAVASAIRIFQAICVAAKRKDAPACRALVSWERATFKYMREHALD